MYNDTFLYTDTEFKDVALNYGMGFPNLFPYLWN